MRGGIRCGAWLLALVFATVGFAIARAEGQDSGIGAGLELEESLFPEPPGELSGVWIELPGLSDGAELPGEEALGTNALPEPDSDGDEEAPAAVSLTLNADKVTLGVGERFQLATTLLDADGRRVEGPVKYVSSRKKRARVSADGVIQGRTRGSCSIRVIGPDGLEAVCRVTVCAAPESIRVIAKKPRLTYTSGAKKGQSTTLKVTLSDGSASAITYSGYDPAVVRVSAKGKVTAVGCGTTVITASAFNGLSAWCVVRVRDSEAPIAENIAHRGGAGYWPENTLKAFRKAASAGADAVELDVRTTRDGIQVVHHNAYIESKGKKIYLIDRDYKSLKALKPDLCTLNQALKVIAQRRLGLYLELKDTANARACVKAVDRWGMRDRTVYISFYVSQLREVRQSDGKARLGYIFGQTPSDVDDVNAELGLTAVGQSIEYLTRAQVVRWQNEGLLVNVWTVNESADIERMLKWGVDSVTGNYPRRVAAALKQ